MSHLRLIGERLRGEDRERRRGERGDLLLKGERLILRRGAGLGLMSLDRSRPLSKSGRVRFLQEVVRANIDHTLSNLIRLLGCCCNTKLFLRGKGDKPLRGVLPVRLSSPDVRRAAPPPPGRSPGSGWGVAALGHPV